MKQNKIFSAAIVLFVIAFLTMGWKPFSPSKSKSGPVTITTKFDGGTFPNLTGSFTTSGALDISGSSAMNITVLPGGKLRCVIVLTTKHGTITIHQQCTPPLGTWQIVSGTGRYVGLNGYGSLMMPPDTEAMTGFIFSHKEEHEDGDD